jgi:hypothetical protein
VEVVTAVVGAVEAEEGVEVVEAVIIVGEEGEEEATMPSWAIRSSLFVATFSNKAIAIEAIAVPLGIRYKLCPMCPIPIRILPKAIIKTITTTIIIITTTATTTIRIKTNSSQRRIFRSGSKIKSRPSKSSLQVMMDIGDSTIQPMDNSKKKSSTI